MSTYSIKGPDGQTYSVDGPAGATREQVIGVIQQKMAEMPDPNRQSTAGEEFMRGLKTTGTAMRTAGEATLGKIRGDQAAQVQAGLSGIERGENIGKEFGLPPGLAPVLDKLESDGKLAAAEEAIAQTPRALMQQSGPIGAFVGGAAAASSLMPVPMLKPFAGIAGGFAATSPQFLGFNIERQIQTQLDQGIAEEDVEVDYDLAFKAALAQGAIETVGQAFVLGKGLVRSIVGGNKGRAFAATDKRKLVEAAGRSLSGATGRGFVMGQAEIPVEVAQQVIERYQAKLDVLSDEAISEYGEAAFLAGTVGGSVGSIGGISERIGSRSQLQNQQALEAEQAAAAATPLIEDPIAEDPIVVEPVVAAADPRAIPTDAKGLKAWGLANLGVGPTATILKPGGVLAGKDLNDPVQAAEVKSELEKYLLTLKKDSPVRPKVAQAIRNLEPQGVTTPNPVVAADPAAAAAAAIAAADKAAADKVIADKAAADKVIADKAAADKVIADKAAADKVIADKAAANKVIVDDEEFVDDIPLEASIWSKDLLGFLTTEYDFTNDQLNELNKFDDADMRGYLEQIKAQDGLVFNGPLTDEVLSSTEEVETTGEGVAKDETKAKVLFNEYGLTEADSAALTNEEFDGAFTKAQEDIQLREPEAAQVTPLSAEKTYEEETDKRIVKETKERQKEFEELKKRTEEEEKVAGEQAAVAAAKVIQDKEDVVTATKEANRIAKEAEQTRDAKARDKVKAKVDRLAYRNKGLAAAVKSDVNKFKSENTTTPYKKDDKPLLGQQAAANYMLAYPDVGDALAVLAAESKLDFTESKKFSITDTSDDTKARKERERVAKAATRAVKWINSNLSPDTRAALAENIAFVEQEIENKKTGAENRERADARNDKAIREVSNINQSKEQFDLKGVSDGGKGTRAVNKAKKKLVGETPAQVTKRLKDEEKERQAKIKDANDKAAESLGELADDAEQTGTAGYVAAIIRNAEGIAQKAEAEIDPTARNNEWVKFIASLPPTKQKTFLDSYTRIAKENPNLIPESLRARVVTENKKILSKKDQKRLVKFEEKFLLKTPKYQGPDFDQLTKLDLYNNDLQSAIQSIIERRKRVGGDTRIIPLIKKIASLTAKTNVVLDGPPIKAKNLDPLRREALEVQEGVEGKTAVEAAKFIADNAPTSDMRVLAAAIQNKLAAYEKALIPVSFKVIHVGDVAPASLNGARGLAVTNYIDGASIKESTLSSADVFINGADVTGKVGTSYEVVLHELLHAVTVSTISDVGGLNDAKTNTAVAELNELFAFTVASIRAKEKNKTLSPFERRTFRGENNFLRNPKELVAWAMTSRSAAEYLESIPYKKGTLFTSFVQTIRKMLGLSETSETALSELIRVTEVLVGTKSIAAGMRKAQKIEGASLEATTLPNFASGAYVPGLNTVVLSTMTGLNEHTLLHESTHAALAQILDKPDHPLTKKFTRFFTQIKMRVGDAYGGTDIQEFAAEYVGNGEFQQILKGIKAPKSENMFIHILQAIAEFFGLRKSQTAYDAAFKFLDQLLDVSQDVELSLVDTMFLGNETKLDSAMAEVTDNLASRSLDTALNKWSNIKDDSFKVTTLGAAGLNNMQSLTKTLGLDKLVAPIGQLLDPLERRRGEVNTKIDLISKNIRQMTTAEGKATPAQRAAFNDLAIDSRLEHIDIFKPAPKGAKGKVKFKQLTNRYNQLPADLQKAYKTLREDLDKSLEEYIGIITDLLPKSASRELMKEFSTMEGVIGYVPFARSGDYWISYEDPSNLDAAGNPTHTPAAFQSIRERKIEIDRLKAKHGDAFPVAQHTNINSVKAPKGLPEGSFVTKLIGELRNNGVEESTIDQVYQQYMTMFPANSIMRQFNKSLNKPGMDRDVITAYSDVAIKWANKIANTKYNPSIEQALDQIENTADAQYGGDPWAQSVKKALRKQEKFFLNPQFAPLAANLTFISYLEYIVGSISSAVVNLTGLIFMVTPMLGARTSYPAALTALNDASSKVKLMSVKENNWGTGKYSALYKELDGRGLLKHTVAREAIERGKTKGKDFDGTFYKAVELFSIPFARSEQFMRSVTAIAAFDLAMKQGVPSDGVAANNEKAAIAFAAKMVRDAHTGGMAETMPRWMQNNFGRVILTFKNIIFQQAYVIGEAIATIFSRRDLPIGVRRVAVRQVLGTYALSTALLGAKGMPFVGAISTLFNIVAALIPDDEDESEPYDFMVEMENSMDDFLYNGMLGSVLNVNVSARAALANDILWRDDPKSIEDYGYVRTAMFTLGGPMFSYAVGAERAVSQDLMQGRYGRFAEGVSPTFIRNGIKSYRFMQDGARNRDGDPIDTDINAWNLMVQAIGFAPADLSNTYRQRSAAKNYENKVLARKQKILNKYTGARKVGDTKRKLEAQTEANNFIRQYPTLMDRNTLERSYKANLAADENSVAGISFTKGLRYKTDEFFE